MSSFLLNLSIVGYYLGLACLLLGLILSSRAARNFVADLYVPVQTSLEAEKSAKSRAISASKKFIDSVYLKNGRLSKVKIAVIALVLNGFFLIGALPALKSYSKEIDLPVTELAISLGSCYALGAFVTEYISAKVAIRFFARADAKNSVLPITSNMLFLVFAFFVAPYVIYILSMVTGNTILVALLVFTPALPTATLLGSSDLDAIDTAFLLPAVFSIVLPTCFGVFGLLIGYSKVVAHVLVSGVEHVSEVGGKRLIALGGALVGIVAGIYTFEVSFE